MARSVQRFNTHPAAQGWHNAELVGRASPMCDREEARSCALAKPRRGGPPIRFDFTCVAGLHAVLASNQDSPDQEEPLQTTPNFRNLQPFTRVRVTRCWSLLS
jgi:hypothetical protein